MAAVSLTPSLVAITAAEPLPTPVTNPVPSTVAAAGLSLVHVVARPGSTFPCASRAVAERCFVMRRSRLTESEETFTDATGGGATTVTGTASLAVPLVAVIVASPRLMPVTVASPGPASPGVYGATVATAGALLFQVTEG